MSLFYFPTFCICVCVDNPHKTTHRIIYVLYYMCKTYLPSLLLWPYVPSATATVLCADALTGHTFTKGKSSQSIIKRPGARKLDRVPQKCTRGETQLGCQRPMRVLHGEVCPPSSLLRPWKVMGELGILR